LMPADVSRSRMMPFLSSIVALLDEPVSQRETDPPLSTKSTCNLQSLRSIIAEGVSDCKYLRRGAWIWPRVQDARSAAALIRHLGRACSTLARTSGKRLCFAISYSRFTGVAKCNRIGEADE
jgi:hypothetical protein